MADKAFKNRGKRCEIHGLLFDPELTSGCARCRKGGDPRAQPPKFLSLLLTLLALTLVGGYVLNGAIQRFRAAGSTETPASAAADPSDVEIRATPRPIDPAAHEQRIRALEAALFDTDESDFAIAADLIVGAATSLESDLRRDDVATPFVAAVADFAIDTRDATASAASLQAARDRWVGLRQGIFRPAPWMAAGTATTNTGGLGVRAHIQAADAIVSTLSSAMDAASEPSETPDDVALGLDTDVADLQASMPSPPPLDADPRLLAGRRALDQVLGEFAALATVPASEARRTALEDLVQRVESTRTDLETLVE